jgi:Ser/Thr protein kinase RdoA (MazF antagonist)
MARHFHELSAQSQVLRLRSVALNALRSYSIDLTRLRLIYHGYNTTFRVDTTDGRRYALRLNVSGNRSFANVAGELSWLAALSIDTDLRVPVPQPNVAGDLCTSVYAADLGREVPAVLFSWLSGPDLEDSITAPRMLAVGRAAAALHAHGEQWALPDGAELPAIDSVLMSTANNLTSEHPLIGTAERSVIDAAFTLAQSHIESLVHGARRHVLHADLHSANLKWNRGRLAVFDFDDCGIGVPAQDLAIAAYYLRDDHVLEAALLEGYQQVRELPAFTADQFEAMLAARNLVLLNDVIASSNAEFRDLVPRYLANTVTKLRHYLDVGVYRHDVPGLIAAD